jgi:putative oxidoreductase
MTTKSKNILDWVLSCFAALIFLASGFVKFGDPHAVANFIGWGYSDSFRVFIGVLELFGAVALLIPPFTTLGASGLSVVMLGAVFTHLSHDQAPLALIPLTLLVIVLYLAYARRSDIGRLHGHEAAAR